jgi:hypothetical protein
MVQRRTHWSARCTACELIESVASEAESPPFDSEADMWRQLLGDVYGWTRRDDGRVLCRAHSGVADCDANGHLIGRWVEHPLDEDLDWRFCTRCGSQFEQRIAG